MNAPEVLPWDHFAAELRDAVKALSARWPAQTVADAAQRWADRMAEHGRHPGADWVALGWRDETEHHDYVAGLRERTLRLPSDAQHAVKQRRQHAGIDGRGPYSTEQALAIDLLIEEAELCNGARTAA